MEAAGIRWTTQLDGPPYIGIDPQMVAGKRVLSIGSLEGNFEWRLAQAGAARVVGIEGVAANFAKCEVLAAAFPELKLEFIHADIVNFNIAPGEFDLIYCLGILYHLAEPQHLLKTLRQSGASPIWLTTQLAVDPPHPAAIKHRLGEPEAVFLGSAYYFGRRFCESFVDGSDGLNSFWFYPEDLEQLVRDLGFEIILWDTNDCAEMGLTLSLVLGAP